MSEKTKRLQYTGAEAKTFPELGAELQPGDPFTVPAGEAERYLRRADVEDARAARRTPQPDSTGESGGDGQPPALTLTSEQDGPLTETVSTDPGAAE